MFEGRQRRRKIGFLKHVLGADLASTQLALADPASDGLGIASGAPGSFGNRQHRRILQHRPGGSRVRWQDPEWSTLRT